MNVLVACEESQRVCVAFRDRGHNAFSCDIQECSGSHPEWHIKADVKPLLNGHCSFYTCDGVAHDLKYKWDMIIAFPPCTYFAYVGRDNLFYGNKLNYRRYKDGLPFLDLFLSIYLADCDKIVIENPRYMYVWNLPKHSQVIQPYQFGEPYSKYTCLWVKGVPHLKPTNIVQLVRPWVSCDKNCRTGVATTPKERSKTFPGIALAMAQQWG